MKEYWKITFGVLVTASLLICLPLAWAESPTDETGAPASSGTDLGIPDSGRINAIIYPFRSATIGTEVRGIVDALEFQEGESVTKGAVVTEVSRERYEAIVGEFKGNYDALVRTLEQASEDLGRAFLRSIRTRLRIGSGANSSLSVNEETG